MSMRYAILAFLLVACEGGMVEGGIPVDPHTRRIALEEWVAQGNPAGTCADQKHLQVKVTNHEEMRAYCPGVGRIFGCFHIHTKETMLDGVESYLTIFVDAEIVGTPEYDITIEHELRHFMAWCSLGDSDSNHDDTRVWHP